MKDRPVALAIVGLGRWGKNYLRVLSGRTDVRVVAVVEPASEAVAPDLLPEDVRVGSELALALHPDVEAVVVATPSHTHAAIATRLIQGGKPVLVEKPAATSETGVRQLSGAARGGSMVLVGHLTLFHPVTEWLEEIVRSGVLGRISHLRSRRVSSRARTSEDSALWALGPHDVCLMSRLAGGRCVGARLLSPPLEVTVAAVNLTFEGGVEASLELSRSGREPARFTEVVGTSGRARIDEVTGVATLHVGPAAEEQFHLGGDGVLARQCAHFLRCVRGLESPRSSLTEGLDVVRALLGAEESGRRGGALVRLDSFLDAVPQQLESA